jgi:catechol 2,3-dioxygenase-like lactoylglutathione lyase family enzyme
MLIGATMSRLQLALNVSDLNEAITYYSNLFGTAPAKVRPGYANFQIIEPPLKLVLMEVGELRGEGTVMALNHLGVEVESAEEVYQASERLRGLGISTREEIDSVCCYARQDKVWTDDPNGAPWEIYTVTDDAPESTQPVGSGACCAPSAIAAADLLMDPSRRGALALREATGGSCCAS